MCRGRIAERLYGTNKYVSVTSRWISSEIRHCVFFMFEIEHGHVRRVGRSLEMYRYSRNEMAHIGNCALYVSSIDRFLRAVLVL